MNKEFLRANDEHTVCHWKGEASYYDIVVGDQENKGAAFYYPEPKEGSVERVKNDFSNYVSFWRITDEIKWVTGNECNGRTVSRRKHADIRGVYDRDR